MKKENKNKIILLIFTIILFIVNTVLVISNNYAVIDDKVHNIVRSLACNQVDIIMKILTFFGGVSFIIILTLVLFIFYMLKHKKNYAYVISGSIIGSTIINNVIKLIIRRPRPEYITVVEKSFSYPSGHTMASTTLYGILIYLISKSKLKRPLKILYSCLLSIALIIIVSLINDKKQFIK